MILEPLIGEVFTPIKWQSLDKIMKHLKATADRIDLEEFHGDPLHSSTRP
jgi:hypothetical protein